MTPESIAGPIIEPGYFCPGCKRQEWHTHIVGCIWQIGPRDPQSQAYNPYVQAGYQILTWPVARIREIPDIVALEILDARIAHEDPWCQIAVPIPADPFFSAGVRSTLVYEPALLLRIRHPIAVRAALGSHLMYERADEFANRVREWLASEHF